MTAAYIAKALEGRRSGTNWMAPCPAHQDGNPSLSLRNAGGTILVHCFAGCAQHDVIAALRERGLWPEPEERYWSQAERRDYGRRRVRAQALAQRALQWRSAMVHQWENAKAAAHTQYLAHPDTQPELSWIHASQQLFFYENLCGATLIQKYREAMERDPAMVARQIAKVRVEKMHTQRCTALVVMTLAVGDTDYEK